jgi:hypothetical protein
MQKQKQASKAKDRNLPVFIEQAIEGVRERIGRNTLMRLHVDTSAKSVVAFSAEWREGNNRIIHRRVCLETKINDSGNQVLIFSERQFDENAKVIEIAPEQTKTIPENVVMFLCKGTLH